MNRSRGSAPRTDPLRARLSHFAYLVLGIDQATGGVLYRYDGVRGKK